MDRGEEIDEQADSYEIYGSHTGANQQLDPDQTNAIQQTPVSQPGRYQYDQNQSTRTEDTAAVSALMQLRGQRQNEGPTQDRVVAPNGNQPTSGTLNMTQFYNNLGRFQGRSDTEDQHQLGMQNSNMPHPLVNPSMSYSDSSIKDTISSLSTTISSIQQQQVSIQQQQVIMANALGNLTTMMQNMHSQPQPQSTRSMHETSGDPSLVGMGSINQAQQSSSAINQTNQVRYEDVSRQMTIQPESQGMVRQYSQNNPLEPTLSVSHDETQQYGWTENRPLSNSRTEGQDRQGNGQDVHQWQGIDETYEQNWTENRPLTNPRRETNVTQGNSLNSQQFHSIDETNQQDWVESRSLTNPTGERNYKPGNYQHSQGVNETSQQNGTESRPLLNTRKEWQPYRQQVSYQRNSSFLDAKLPPYNGKEDWKVWLNRFEAVANRRNWDDDTKLDNLLPKLQGRAGDFVFTQLSEETISSYFQLIKELNSRFRVVETQKTFAAKFSNRAQKHDETVEEYAAELKRLYSKAYRNRDSSTRQEDLVRRFLNGLKDSEASFEIEFHKEPEDIDEAVYHAVNFIQTKKRSNPGNYQDKKFKRYARRANYEDEIEDVETDYADDDRHEEETVHIMRLPSKDEQQKRKTQKGEHRKENPQSQSDSLVEVKEMLKSLAGKVEELQKDSKPREEMKQNMPVVGKSGILCYACKERGHIARDCPSRQQSQRPRNDANRQQNSQGRVEIRAGQNVSPLN